VSRHRIDGGSAADEPSPIEGFRGWALNWFDTTRCAGRLPKLVESAHIPVQSGSDRMLKAMHRGYTRDRSLSIIQKLRKVNPRMGITTHIIVGFPGETEEDFEQTLSLYREADFDNAFIFRYSKRKDTPAADMPNQLPEEVKGERNQRLLALTNELGAKRYGALIGERVQILVEGPSKRPERMMGRTRCNKIVVFDGSDRHRGELMDVSHPRRPVHALRRPGGRME
jgi:tRNA-2-methylthio-N6-dimethylallyladenosine synthase